ncbi:MAG TPA: histidine kinase dimerization/phospho-acceptor domain-containing protein, partial [Acetobacteraceae bacterium]
MQCSDPPEPDGTGTPPDAARFRDAVARHGAARGRVLALLRGRGPETRALATEIRALDAIDAELTEMLDTPARPADSAHQAQVFQSRKLEAIGQLTGGIAHDFNNLLTVITAGLQLLSRATDAERRLNLTRRIEEAAWRGADLTRRLLAFARRQPLNPKALELATHIEGLRELLRHGLRSDISILTNIQDGLWPVSVDLAALELAVLNLAVNARDAMPNGGTMVLGARNVGRDGIGHLDVAPDDYVELFVT